MHTLWKEDEDLVQLSPGPSHGILSMKLPYVLYIVNSHIIVILLWTLILMSMNKQVHSYINESSQHNYIKI